MTLNSIKDITVGNHKFEASDFYSWSLTPPTRKGKIGEDVARELLEGQGYEISDRNTKEHDYICDGKMIELKTAFEKEDAYEFTFYGYDATEDPHFWDLQFVMPELIAIIRMDRKAMADIYLGKTRKNTMFTITPEIAVEAGGKVIAEYEIKK